MNRMFRKYAAFALLAAMTLESNEIYNHTPKRDIKPKNQNKPIPQGCKRFYYEDGYETIAISQKSADKKHDKWMKL